MNDEELVCPYCGTHNRSICHSCKQIIEDNWIVCPYCGEPSKDDEKNQL